MPMRDLCTDKQTAYLLKRGMKKPWGKNYCLFELIEWLQEYARKNNFHLMIREVYPNNYWVVDFEEWGISDPDISRMELIDAVGATVATLLNTVGKIE
jgi:hypothetical protein